MKKIKKVEKHFPAKKRYDGIFDPKREDLELSSNIVSATEMTGAIPAEREKTEKTPNERETDYLS